MPLTENSKSSLYFLILDSLPNDLSLKVLLIPIHLKDCFSTLLKSFVLFRMSQPALFTLLYIPEINLIKEQSVYFPEDKGWRAWSRTFSKEEMGDSEGPLLWHKVPKFLLLSSCPEAVLHCSLCGFSCWIECLWSSDLTPKKWSFAKLLTSVDKSFCCVWPLC